MNPLPPDTNLDFLIGQTLLQVCIGENEVILNFYGSISITIFCDFDIQAATGKAEAFEDPRTAASALVQLISEDVVKISNQNNGTITLWFTGGKMLAFHDTHEMYESYVIQNGDDFYVV